MTTWKTKTGKMIELEDMSDDHIHNVINQLERVGREGSPTYHEMHIELFVREHSRKYPELRQLVELLKAYSRAQNWEEHKEDYRDCVQEF
jgi:hypothetical protein